MTAKEYYGKYRDRILAEILDPDTDGVEIPDGGMIFREYRIAVSKKACCDLMSEIHCQVIGIVESNLRNPDKALAAIREANDTWNSIADMFAEKDNAYPLRKDGVINFYCTEIPELKQYFEKKEK